MMSPFPRNSSILLRAFGMIQVFCGLSKSATLKSHLLLLVCAVYNSQKRIESFDSSKEKLGHQW